MKKYFYLIIFILIISIVINSCKVVTKYHKPIEILKMLAINYNIKVNVMISNQVKSMFEKIQKNSLPYDQFIDTSNSQHIVKRYSLLLEKDSESLSNLEKANEYFSNYDYSNCRKNLFFLHNKYPYFSSIMVQIGETFLFESNIDSSIYWFNKAIENNYYDCLAHKYKAEINIQNGEQNIGLNEIIISHILNRNDSIINNSLLNIIKNLKMKYNNWEFNPPVDVVCENGANICRLDTNFAYWTTYGFCKSLWKFSGDYKNFMINEFKNELPRQLEEEECLFNLYEGNLTNNKSNYIRDLLVEKIFDIYLKDNKKEFIFYEIILKENPEIIYNLNKENIDALVAYFIKYHINT